jgi:transposase
MKRKPSRIRSACGQKNGDAAAVAIGRTETALGALYRRLSARLGKAKAVTATARKITVLFYNALRHGMNYVDPGDAKASPRRNF